MRKEKKMAADINTALSTFFFVCLHLQSVIGGYTVLATKGVSSLLSLSFYKMFTYPISYLLVFVLVSTAVLQIKFLNKSLQRFDSTVRTNSSRVLTFIPSSLDFSLQMMSTIASVDFSKLSLPSLSFLQPAQSLDQEYSTTTLTRWTSTRGFTS